MDKKDYTGSELELTGQISCSLKCFGRGVVSYLALHIPFQINGSLFTVKFGTFLHNLSAQLMGCTSIYHVSVYYQVSSNSPSFSPTPPSIKNK